MNPRLKKNPNFWSDLMKKMASYLLGFWIKARKISNRNLLTKLIEFQTVPCHSFQFVQFWKLSIMIRTVSFCSVSFLFVSYRFKYKLLAIHYVPFRSVSFPRSQTVCSSSTRCLYVCLLFRITVNYADMGINSRTSPKTIRSQKILLHHNMSIQS